MGISVFSNNFTNADVTSAFAYVDIVWIRPCFLTFESQVVPLLYSWGEKEVLKESFFAQSWEIFELMPNIWCLMKGLFGKDNLVIGY